eukprot:3242229-Amphidinium_carterae.1
MASSQSLRVEKVLHPTMIFDKRVCPKHLLSCSVTCNGSHRMQIGGYCKFEGGYHSRNLFYICTPLKLTCNSDDMGLYKINLVGQVKINGCNNIIKMLAPLGNELTEWKK